MTHLLTFILGLLLIGCGDYIYPEEWEAYKSVCEVNGGIDYVYVTNQSGYVQCNNKANFMKTDL